jgi:hypothetical protein
MNRKRTGQNAKKQQAKASACCLAWSWFTTYFILPPSSFILGLRCSPEFFTPEIRGRDLHLAD